MGNSSSKSPPNGATGLQRPSLMVTQADEEEERGIAKNARAINELIAFHAEIRAALERLHLLVIEAGQGTKNASSATALIRFFEGPLLWHDEDEEVSLMRRLRRVKLTAGQTQVIEQTLRGHDRMETMLDELLQELRKLAAEKDGVDLNRLDSEARALRALLDGHLALEEASLFPMVSGVLSAEELDDVAHEIDARHGRTGSGERARRAVPL